MLAIVSHSVMTCAEKLQESFAIDLLLCGASWQWVTAKVIFIILVWERRDYN